MGLLGLAKPGPSLTVFLVNLTSVRSWVFTLPDTAWSDLAQRRPDIFKK